MHKEFWVGTVIMDVRERGINRLKMLMRIQKVLLHASVSHNSQNQQKVHVTDFQFSAFLLAIKWKGNFYKCRGW